MPSRTETRLPWGDDTITIKGRNSGIQHLTVCFDGETLNIVEFLNHNLKAEYAAIYEAIMSAYEAKLKSGDIFAHNFPEAQFACKKIDTTQLQNKPDHSFSDNELIEALLKEYHTYLDDIQTHFKQYEAHVEQWYNGLQNDTKNK
jgi:hypothetical protein